MRAAAGFAAGDVHEHDDADHPTRAGIDQSPVDGREMGEHPESVVSLNGRIPGAPGPASGDFSGTKVMAAEFMQ